MSKERKRRSLGAVLRAFLGDIAGSVYDVERYRVFRAQPLSSAIRYFAALSFVIAVVVIVGFAPTMMDIFRTVRDDVVRVMPEGAEFTIKDGKFSTTIPTPYSKDIGSLTLVMDDSLQGTELPDGVYEQEFAAIIGQDALFLVQDGYETQVHPFAQRGDVSVSRESLLDWFRTNTFTTMFLTLVVFGVIYFLFTLFGVGVYVFVTSAFVLLFARLWKVRLKYMTWVAIGMHAVTLPLIADLVFDSFLRRLPSLFMVLYMMIIIAVIVDERSRPVKGV